MIRQQQQHHHHQQHHQQTKINNYNNNNKNNAYNIIKNIIFKIFKFLSKLTKIILALIFTLITWFTIYHLIQLLSYSINTNENNNNTTTTSTTSTTTINLLTGVPTYDMIKDLFYNGLLVSIFIFQHSFMATSFYKSLIKNSNFFYSLQRSIYNFFTCITIEVMISNWRPIDSFLIWDLTNYENTLSIIKTIFLFIILIEFILFLNFFEFFGLAQVWSDCIKNKEYELPIKEKNRLYSIMRHPNTVSLLIIIWFSSLKMTLDIFTCCTFFTFYLLSGNSKSSSSTTNSINKENDHQTTTTPIIQ